MKEFITPPDHIHFLAKKLFADCGEIIGHLLLYLEKAVVDLLLYILTSIIICSLWSAGKRVELDGEIRIVDANESFLVNGHIPHSVWNNMVRPSRSVFL